MTMTGTGSGSSHPGSELGTGFDSDSGEDESEVRRPKKRAKKWPGRASKGWKGFKTKEANVNQLSTRPAHPQVHPLYNKWPGLMDSLLNDDTNGRRHTLYQGR